MWAYTKEVPLGLISGTWVQRTFKEAAYRGKLERRKRRRRLKRKLKRERRKMRKR